MVRKRHGGGVREAFEHAAVCARAGGVLKREKLSRVGAWGPQSIPIPKPATTAPNGTIQGRQRLRRLMKDVKAKGLWCWAGLNACEWDMQ